MMYYYGPGGGGLGIFYALLHVLGIVITILVIVWILRMILWGGRRRHYQCGRRPWWGNTGSGIEILNERYAKGEIEKAEYEERKKTLMG